MIITEAIAQIMHDADRQLMAIHGIRNIDSWAMLGDARKKERIAMVEMIKAGSEMPAVSVDTELGRYRSRLMKSIVGALSRDVEEITAKEDPSPLIPLRRGTEEPPESPEGTLGEESSPLIPLRKGTRKTTKEGANDGI